MQNKFVTFRASDGYDRIIHLRPPFFCLKVLPEYSIADDVHNVKYKGETYCFSFEKRWQMAIPSKFNFILPKAAAYYSKYQPSNERPKKD